MAIRSGFFNSVNGDRKYSASHFAEYFASFISNGVFPNPSTNLQVMANNDMTVTVQAGKAWINGHILINDDDYVLEIELADGVLNRIDRVVARYDTVDREIRLEVKKGTFASSPVAPELQRDADAYELALADIYVAKGAVSITQANITDLRFNTELCGIVKGTVDQIDTTDLFAQYQAAFNDWFQELKDVLDDNTAANLLNLINQLDDDLASHKADYATLDKAGHVKAETDAEGKLILDIPKSNYNADRPPSENDDETKGYSVGSRWIVENQEWVCFSAESNDAQWGNIALLNKLKYNMFDSGNEYSKNTGGWQQGYTKPNQLYHYENTGEYLNIQVLETSTNPTGSGSIIVGTRNKIEMSKLNKIMFDAEMVNSDAGSYIRFGISDDVNQEQLIASVRRGAQSVSDPANFTREVIELDVSSLSGEYHVVVNVKTVVSGTRKATGKVYRVWGEIA